MNSWNRKKGKIKKSKYYGKKIKKFRKCYEKNEGIKIGTLIRIKISLKSFRSKI